MNAPGGIAVISEAGSFARLLFNKNKLHLYAIIDIETTGGQPSQDAITEIAIVLHDGQQITDQYSTLINPERPIPFFITQLTGISD